MLLMSLPFCVHRDRSPSQIIPLLQISPSLFPSIHYFVDSKVIANLKLTQQNYLKNVNYSKLCFAYILQMQVKFLQNSNMQATYLKF